MKLAPSLRHSPSAIALLILMLTACGCSRGQQPGGAADGGEIIVAAASNLTDAFQELAAAFTTQTGIRVIYSFGATADLTKQIEHGAPFDLFASADVEQVDRLEAKGLLAPGSRALYARGRLVLWVPPGSRAGTERVEDIVRADVKTVAVAKPDLAPYGRAAVEALRSLDLWPQVETKAVYAQSVSQVKQFASSGNADVAFLPLALVKGEQGRVIEIDGRLHQPINQALGILKASSRQEAARRFADFILSADGESLLESYGYLKPSTDNL